MAESVALVVDQLRRSVAGGIGTYIRGLAAGLHAMGDDAPAVTAVAARPPGGSGPDPVAELGFPIRTSPLPSKLLTRAWDHGVATGPVAGAAVIHAASLAAPYRRHTPTVVMVHDVAWREAPETFPSRGRRWHEQALQRCLSRATTIVVPSARTAEMLHDRRVVVIPEGADHLPSSDPSAAEELLDRLGVTGPYLLSVSTLEPRKNLPRILDAYTKVVPRLPEAWPLLVAGPSGWGASLAPVPGVKLTGMVSDEVLSGLYAGARCLVYAPLVEGWGLPAVEAMHAGLPVVASPMPSTADAALEVDPLDVDAIAEGIVAAATDEQVRRQLIAAGTTRAASLTWKTAARAHVAVWKQCA